MKTIQEKAGEIKRKIMWYIGVLTCLILLPLSVMADECSKDTSNCHGSLSYSGPNAQITVWSDIGPLIFHLNSSPIPYISNDYFSRLAPKIDPTHTVAIHNNDTIYFTNSGPEKVGGFYIIFSAEDAVSRAGWKQVTSWAKIEVLSSSFACHPRNNSGNFQLAGYNCDGKSHPLTYATGR
ncbi:MAG: hypothetical protein HQK84_11865 [Nitrospinae bacterium]|nr:hypothetical protein [Nitrospinota bacterium]